MRLLTKEQQESFIFVKKIKKEKYVKGKKCCKVRDHCNYTGEYRGAVHSICYLKYGIPNKILQLFVIDLTINYHFILKELAEEFQKNYLLRRKH